MRWDDEILSIPCRGCGVAEGDVCVHEDGSPKRKIACLARLQDRDRAQDAADRLREAGYGVPK
jgi:hypothetical protein